MLQVLEVKKTGKKVDGYLCKEGTETFLLNKQRLYEQIKANNVTNAKAQVYRGNVIIRLQQNVKVTQRSGGEVTKPVSSKASSKQVENKHIPGSSIDLSMMNKNFS